MAYEKLNLSNGTVLTAEHLAHIEDGIANSQPVGEYALKDEIPSDNHINSLINAAIGVIENGTY